VAGRERDLERLLTFIDAVVAIAITLLVLPLAEAGSEIHGRTVPELLREHVDDLLGFFLSFTVIARLWLAQHAILGCLTRQNGAVIRLLFCWSLTIVFLPFPTTLVTATSNDGAAKLLYIGTMAVSSALLALLARVISRDRTLRDTEDGPDTAIASAVTVTFLLALVIGVVFPATSYWPLLLLVLTDPVVHRLRRTRVARSRNGS
jgi:uncharacterized membrane protein